MQVVNLIKNFYEKIMIYKTKFLYLLWCLPGLILSVVFGERYEKILDNLFDPDITFTQFFYQHHLIFGATIILTISYLLNLYLKRSSDEYEAIVKKNYKSDYLGLSFLLTLLGSWIFLISHEIFTRKFKFDLSDIVILYDLDFIKSLMLYFITLFGFIMGLLLMLRYVSNIHIKLSAMSIIICLYKYYTLDQDVSFLLSIFFLSLSFTILSFATDFFNDARKISKIYFKKIFLFGLAYLLSILIIIILSIVLILNIFQVDNLSRTIETLYFKNLVLIFLFVWFYRFLSKLFSSFVASEIYLNNEDNVRGLSIFYAIKNAPQLSIVSFFSSFYIFSCMYVFFTMNSLKNHTTNEYLVLLTFLIYLSYKTINYFAIEDNVVPHISIYKSKFNMTTCNMGKTVSSKKYEQTFKAKFYKIMVKIFLLSVFYFANYNLLTFLGFSDEIIIGPKILSDNLLNSYKTQIIIFCGILFLIFLDSFSNAFFALNYLYFDNLMFKNNWTFETTCQVYDGDNNFDQPIYQDYIDARIAKYFP